MKTLLTRILFFITIAPLFGQDPACPPPKDGVWINKRFPGEIQPYENRTTLIFELVNTDTVSVVVGGKLIAKEYMQSTSAGRVRKDFTVNQAQGKVITIKTATRSCTQFKLKKGYRFAYINQDDKNKWVVIYSKYKRAYY